MVITLNICYTIFWSKSAHLILFIVYYKWFWAKLEKRNQLLIMEESL